MADIRSKVNEIYSLEQLSGKRTCIHALHPVVKIISTVIYIIIVVSFGRYDFARLIPYIFYPAILMPLAEIPYKLMFKRVALALPFCLIAGLSNVFLSRGTMFVFMGISFSYGFISLVAIVFRTLLCVFAVLLLVAVTPFSELTGQMRRMKIPGIFITLFEMTYRYIGTLLEEASTMFTAYSLRSSGKKGLEMKHMGSFVGQLFIRSFDKAERIYSAMKCRGYTLKSGYAKSRSFSASDYIFLAAVCIPTLLLRFLKIF